MECQMCPVIDGSKPNEATVQCPHCGEWMCQECWDEAGGADGCMKKQNEEDSLTIKANDDKEAMEAPRFLYITLHRGKITGTFDTPEAVKRYPGPRGLECAEKEIRVYVDRVLVSKEEDEIQQILGKALGYPWYKDDQKNFPGATEENGVFVGEHIAVTLAMEAARKIADHEEVKHHLVKDLTDAMIERVALQSQLAAKDAMLAAATDVIRQCKDAIDSVTFHSIRGYATVYIIDSRKHYEARRVAAGWLEPTKGAEHHG